jgi:hypothetical protein
MFFAKIPRGIKAFRKNCQGGPPISGFIACFEICLGGLMLTRPPSPLTPPCASMLSGKIAKGVSDYIAFILVF